ncbi:MAG: hypothetical protein K5873_07025 [Treponema sp.]|nr:hypothetical protein [Treponema sp.]
MNDKKLKQLFDFQKFSKNSAMEFAISSARSYIDSVQSKGCEELSDEELEMVNAAGVDSVKIKLPQESLPNI